MSVATDLQDLIADVSAAIAGATPWHRADLEILRRKLDALAIDARVQTRRVSEARLSITNLADAIDGSIVDLSAHSRRARQRLAALDEVTA